MACSSFFNFAMSFPSLVLVLALLSDCSIVSLAVKLETTFPAGTAAPDGSSELVAKLRMQGALPTTDKLMQCTGFILADPVNNPFWVLQLTGHAPSTTVHHLALYGCTHKTNNPCECNLRERTTIFVSALNTPPIRYPILNNDQYFGDQPEQVGLQIGGSSTIQYILMEVHYKSALTVPDTTTGVDLQYTTNPVSVYVGIQSLMGVGTLPPGITKFNLDSCLVQPLDRIYVFGYQVHTHSLGRLVSMYNNYYDNQIVDIGRGNPQYPQAYYPTLPKGETVPINQDHTILLRCVFDTSSQTNPTYTIGVPGKVGTEMCFGNLLYAYPGVLPPVNSFLRGTCSDEQVGYFPSNTTDLFPYIEKLHLHALHGNQTGIVNIDAKYSMNLDLETFT